MSADDLAARLLDAQVAWVLEQLDDEGLGVLIEREVAELLEVGAQVRLRDVVSREGLAGAARRAGQALARSPAAVELAREIPVRLHGSPENARYRLADVVERADVEALVEAVLGLDRWQERTLERLAGSPLAGVVANAFVSRLVGDVLAQNTDLARRLPGMSSLIAFGGTAVGKVKGLADRQLEGVLGEAMGKGGELAVRRVNAALLAVLRTGPVREAVLESWDLEAGERLSALAADLPVAGVREVAAAAAHVAVHCAGGDYAAVVVDTLVEVLLERHGDQPMAELVAASSCIKCQ